MKTWTKIIIAVSITLLIAGGAIFGIVRYSRNYINDYAEQVKDTYNRSKVTFLDCGTVVAEFDELNGSSIKVPEAKGLEGYKFDAWVDDDGKEAEGAELTVSEDAVYKASYIIAGEGSKHKAYLFFDNDGFYHPSEPLTRHDAVHLLYSFLDEPEEAEKNYKDVKKKSDIYSEALAIKKLGLIDGDYLYPDRTVTKAELADMLKALYPYADNELLDYSNIQNKNEEITRYETAAYINKLFGRVPDKEYIDKLIGVIPDANLENDKYYDFAEGAVSHEIDEKTGKWIENVKFKKAKEGVYFVNGEMYGIKSNGTVAVNESVGNFLFDVNGKYTSGNKKLDALINELIAENTTDEMTQYEKFQTMYYYIVKSFDYRKGNLYEIGETGWSVDEAYDMLVNGKGNCYSYAALVCEFAKALGFDAIAWSGTVVNNAGTPVTPHGWVEIELEGEKYVCDAELEMKKMTDCFMMPIDAPYCRRWKYNHVPKEEITEDEEFPFPDDAFADEAEPV